MKKKLLRLISENNRVLPGMAVIGVLVLLLILKWGYNHHQRSASEIIAYNDLLQASSSIAERGSEIEKIIAGQNQEISALEKGLLKAQKPSIAAAELQEAFKKILARKNIIISSENVLAFEESGEYIKIPVEFHLKAELGQLTRLLYDVRLSPLLMGVRSMHIRTLSAADNAIMNITLVLEGAIRNTGGTI
ncbi:MAG: GspMb/PilO family protein [Thermodesulfobacteriota bacterium]